MVLVSYSGREINAKLVYYGPGLSGKTTNLEYIYSSIPQGQRGKMVSMKTKTERTLFFDFLPVHLGELSGFKTRFLLYTVPGQVYYNATRKLVLKGVDAVVFVADSKRGKMDENVESLENLKENLKDLGLTLDRLPWVIQYNKRDLSDVYMLEELEAVLNPGRAPAYEGVASTGVGVVETFKGISRLLLRKLAKDVGVPVVGSTVEADAGRPAPPAAAAVVGATMSPAVVANPLDRAVASPVATVSEVPVSVYAADSLGTTWSSRAPAAVEVPVTEPAAASSSSWVVGGDSDLTDLHLDAPQPAAGEDRSSPPDREVSEPGSVSQFPPVAEPVRMPGRESGDPSGWDVRTEGDEPSEHRASVGERLRRWLSRSPAPIDAEDEPQPPAQETVEPMRAQEVGADTLMAPTPVTQLESELLRPISGIFAAEEPAAVRHGSAAHDEPAAARHDEPAAARHDEPAAARHDEPAGPSVPAPGAESTAEFSTEPAGERAAEFAADPRIVAFQVPVRTAEPLSSEPAPTSRTPVREVAGEEMPARQTGSMGVIRTPGSPEVSGAAAPAAPAFAPTVGAPPPPAAAPASRWPAPASMRETQPSARRRRPREIIVPVELSPDDLAEGVVLKVAISVRQSEIDDEDETDQYAA